jgi:hypothetical protein
MFATVLYLTTSYLHGLLAQYTLGDIGTQLGMLDKLILGGGKDPLRRAIEVEEVDYCSRAHTASKVQYQILNDHSNIELY